MFSLDVIVNTFQPYKATEKITILHDLIFTALESRKDAVSERTITNIHNLFTPSIMNLIPIYYPFSQRLSFFKYFQIICYYT